MKLDHSLPTEGASGFRTARRDLVLLGVRARHLIPRPRRYWLTTKSTLFAKP